MTPPAVETTFDFVIAGAARSGTTSLHRYLALHPKIFLPTAKELAFFAAPAGDSQQRDLIRSFYSSSRADQCIGLSDANLLLVPEAGSRLRDHNREMKVVVSLRDPTDRAYSAYWFGRLRGWETLESFEAALERERLGRLEARYERVNFAYIEHGYYARHLAPIIAALGRRQVKVVLTEDLARRPRETLLEVFDFLGASRPPAHLDFSQRHNRAQRTRFARLGAALEAGLQPLRRALRRTIPIRGRHWLRHHVVRRARQLNRVDAEIPPIGEAVRAALKSHYRVHNQRLSALIGRDLAHWS